jgi:hypothetical protein
MRVIIGGADTLRVGHWLKFGYGLAIAVVVAGMTFQCRLAIASSRGTFAAGWFAVLISLAAWRMDMLPRWLNGLGIVAGTLLIPCSSCPIRSG